MELSQNNLTNNPDKTIPLTKEQSLQLKKSIKIGLYKELHKKGILTNEQLSRLISLQNI